MFPRGGALKLRQEKGHFSVNLFMKDRGVAKAASGFGKNLFLFVYYCLFLFMLIINIFFFNIKMLPRVLSRFKFLSFIKMWVFDFCCY